MKFWTGAAMAALALYALAKKRQVEEMHHDGMVITHEVHQEILDMELRVIRTMYDRQMLDRAQTAYVLGIPANQEHLIEAAFEGLDLDG